MTFSAGAGTGIPCTYRRKIDRETCGVWYSTASREYDGSVYVLFGQSNALVERKTRTLEFP